MSMRLGILVGIVLLTISADTIYLTSTFTKDRNAPLVTLLNNLQLCTYRDRHISVLDERSATFGCTVDQVSHCLWRKTQFSLPNTTTYCGIITSLPDRLVRSIKRMITIKVERNHRINIHFLRFNFQWIDLYCAAHGIAVIELNYDRNRNMFCGNRLPWTLVSIGNQAIVEIVALVDIKYEFRISYFHCKLRWFDAIYLELNDLHDISKIKGDFFDLTNLITGYDYYILVDPWLRIRITLLYDIYSNAIIYYYDGPGDKSDIIQQIGIKSVVTTSYRAMIRINMPIEVTIEYDVFNTADFPLCGVSDVNQTIFLKSAINIACMDYVDVRSHKEGSIISTIYPLLVIKHFSFHGPLVITGESDHNCQYGGLFIWKHINKESTYICEHLHNYTVYSDVSPLVIFLVWYPGYSDYLLDAQFKTTECFTMYSVRGRMLPSRMDNAFTASDSLPCQLIICTPSQFRKHNGTKYCTIDISTDGSIGTASILVKHSDFLQACSYVEFGEQNYTIYANSTENWPFSKPRLTTIFRSSDEELHGFYPYLNQMRIILPFLCPKEGSTKQMSVKMEVSMCKSTTKGIVRRFFYDMHPITSECSNLKVSVKFFFKPDPYFNITAKQLTVTQKEGDVPYVGVVVRVAYQDCPEECRTFIYTLTVLQRWRERIYQYTNPVGTDTFTGYFYQGLKLTVARPQDICGRHLYCTITYSLIKSMQTFEMASNTNVTILDRRTWHFRSKRYSI